MLREIDPQRRAMLAAAFKDQIKEYREWALDPRTSRFLGLAADVVVPAPSSATERSVHSEAVSRLVVRETIDALFDAVFKLEDYAGFVAQESLPEPTYGAEAPAEVEPSPTKPSPRRRK